MSIQLHAQPYDTSATGFYFTSLEDYEAKYAARLPVEEYEIQFIDGTNSEQALSKYLDVTQCNLNEYFELIETEYDEEELEAIEYLVNNVGLKLSDALERFDEVQVYRGNINDWAHEEAEAMGLEGFALRYFDAASYVHDCECNGELVELAHNVHVTNANGF